MLAERTGPERFLTAAYVRLRLLDGAGAQATVCLAGHPPPLLVAGDGAVTPVGAAGDLLGVLADVDLVERTFRLAPGDSLLLYTDGVVEAHGPAGLFGEARLREVLASAAGLTADALASRLAQAVTGYRTGGADDLALLVLRLAPPDQPAEQPLVDERLPADPTAARTARRLVTAAARSLPGPVVEDLALVVSELVGNAVAQLDRHSPAGLRADPVRVRLTRAGSLLHVEVGNPGRDFTPPPGLPDPHAERGRGLAVVRSLTTRLGVDRIGGTTRVWCELRVGQEGGPSPR